MVRVKKMIAIFTLLIFSALSSAQEFSYGFSLSRIRYEANNDNARYQFGNRLNKWTTGFGAYGEYNFNQNVGIKTELIYISKDLSYHPPLGADDIPYTFNVVELAPSFKYDFGSEYRKGFYMMIGPKVTFVTQARPDDMDFKKMTFGSQFVLGQRVFKIVDIQAKLDYDVTPFFNVDDYHTSFFAGSFSVGVDLERILNKK